MVEILYLVNCVNIQIAFTTFYLIGISYQSLENKLKKHEWRNRTNESNPNPYIGHTLL